MSADLSHRKAAVKLRLVSKDGTPAANREIKITQKTHQFLFGIGGFEVLELAGGTSNEVFREKSGGQPIDDSRKSYLEEKIGKLFTFNNYATLPFYIGLYEHVEGRPDEGRMKAGANWFKQRDITLKGHPLCWHTVCADWLMNYSNSEILKKVIGRIERDVSVYAGIIDIWDVINEVVIMPIFDKYDNAITRICREYGQVPLVKEVFNAAKKTNPNAVLLLNDFDVSKDYEILIEKVLDAGVPVDVIGIQSHQHKGYWGAEKLNDCLQRFSRFGLPLHFTENTIVSGDLMPAHIKDLNDWQAESWPTNPEGEQRQKKELTEMYEILFAHPQVQAITTWSGCDENSWLHAPAGILRSDNSEKPSYSALKSKIENEWHTEIKTITDNQGFVNIEGFKGKYEISGLNRNITFNLNNTEKELELKYE